MKNIWRIFAKDIKGLVKNPFAMIIALGLCVIPSLYAWFNIYSNWDPYANTSNIKIAVVSEDFAPPLLARADGEQVAGFLRGFGITRVVRTRGERPVQYWWDGTSGEVPVEAIPDASTLGAGDAFHGAFTWAIERGGDADPERLAQIHARRAAIKDVLRGRAADVESLLTWADDARARVDELSAPASDPEVVERELAAAQSLVLDVGARLTKARTRLARELAAGVNEELHALAMPDATLDIDLEATKPTSHGCETVVFRLQPHPHAPARPLGQGASGGELSRVMLALELMLGRTEASSTFIFDEIDAGIGGQTATEVGARLKRLAASRQVIVVTHLAQVAAFGDQHLVIEKTDGTTSVREVTGAEREAELTRMMGGDPHSQAARRHASRVLASAVSQSQG